MRDMIELELIRLGGLPNTKGYGYTVDTLVELLQSGRQIDTITAIYKWMGNKVGARPESVERSMRGFIEGMWRRGDQELHRMFHEQQPSNKEFIATLHRYIFIHQKMREKALLQQ